MKLIDIYQIKGTLKLITGLHIGASKDVIQIGGIDSPVVKNPITSEPYIPGSSIKGKVRSLLEWYFGKVQENKTYHSCSEKNCEICRIFGTSEKHWEWGPTRSVFRDAFITSETIDLFNENEALITEEKSENCINRIEGRAENPRVFERVSAGSAFDLEINYKIIDTGDEGATDIKYFENLKKGLKLLTLDCLGGSGSRGYGKVELVNLTVTDKNDTKPFTLDEVSL